MSLKRLYLRGLPEFVGEDEVSKHLSSYGKIAEVKILGDYGFVQFESEKDAIDVLDTFRRLPFLGKTITIELAHPLRKGKPSFESSNSAHVPHRSRPSLAPPHVQERYPVVVTNLPREICWQELKDFGRLSGGLVAYCDIDKDRRGRGFIEYMYREDAERAIQKLNGRFLGGRSINVFSREPRNVPHRQKGSRSRSPSHHYRSQYYSSSSTAAGYQSTPFHQGPSGPLVPHHSSRSPVRNHSPSRTSYYQDHTSLVRCSPQHAFSLDAYSDELYEYNDQVGIRQSSLKHYDYNYNYDSDRDTRERYTWESEREYEENHRYHEYDTNKVSL